MNQGISDFMEYYGPIGTKNTELNYVLNNFVL